MVELDHQKSQSTGITLRLWFFVVGWIGFHLHFAILSPMLGWLPYTYDAADTWLFLINLIGFVLFLAVVVFLAVKTAFLHAFLDQVILVVIWFFVGFLGVPYVGSKVIAWWQLSTSHVVIVKDDSLPQTWDRNSLYKLEGFEQLTESQNEVSVKRLKRNPRSGHTYESTQRYWICPISNRAESALTIGIFMVNTKGLDAAESYSPTMVAKLETNPYSIPIYDDLANRVLQSGGAERSESKIYLSFFDLASRLKEYKTWALGSYVSITTLWLLSCLVFTRTYQ